MFSKRMNSTTLGAAHQSPSTGLTIAGLTQRVRPTILRPSSRRIGFCQTMQFGGNCESGLSQQDRRTSRRTSSDHVIPSSSLDTHVSNPVVWVKTSLVPTCRKKKR